MEINFKQIMIWRKEKLEKQLESHIKSNLSTMKERKRQTSIIKMKSRIAELSYLLNEWNKRVKQ